ENGGVLRAVAPLAVRKRVDREVDKRREFEPLPCELARRRRHRRRFAHIVGRHLGHRSPYRLADPCWTSIERRLLPSPITPVTSVRAPVSRRSRSRFVRNSPILATAS